MDLVERWMGAMGLGGRLRRRIKTYYAEVRRGWGLGGWEVSWAGMWVSLRWRDAVSTWSVGVGDIAQNEQAWLSALFTPAALPQPSILPHNTPSTGVAAPGGVL